MKKTIVFWTVVIVLVGIAIALVFYKSFWSIRNTQGPAGDSQQLSQESRAAQQAAAQKQEASPKVSTLMFDSAQQSVATDTKVLLKAMIDPKGMKVSASQLNVTFDPKMLKLESVEPSDGFSLVLAKAEIDNEKGTATIALGVPLGKAATESVSPVAIFNFQTLSTTGQTKVSFADKSGAAADGATGNIISSLEPATINIQ
jgi:hypothetical protein